MNKVFLALSTIIVLGIGAYFAFANQTPSQTLNYQTLEGTTITSNDLKGKVVLVKFWATTCTTCIKQMPQTIAYYEQYKDQGYETIGVAMSYDKPEAIKNFIQNRALPFTVAYDASGELAKAFGGVRFTPVAFLLDRQGNIVKRYIGEYDKTEFIQTLEQTLAKK